jgi:uncharacterized protein YndB with AHSA1/START domain
MSAPDTIQRKTTHGTFTVKRTYDASSARVFQAFADKEAKAKWFSGPQGVEEAGSKFDFRVDGQEIVFGRHANDIRTAFYAVYQDIVPDERIIYTYRMTLNGTPISASLATIEITPCSDGTQVTWTEYGVYLDGFDNPAVREEGTGWLMDKIGASLND